LLPTDLEESAYRTSALIRCRNISNAAAFMRMALAYAVSDLSLKDVAAWASALQVAQITGAGKIEMLFKRLKSLLHLDALPSREGPTAKSWMLARLIAATLAQRLVQPARPLSPWGYVLRGTDPIREGKKEEPRARLAPGHGFA
jgi:hypothetical protein